MLPYIIPVISACIKNMIISIMTWLDLDSLGQNNQPLYKCPISEAKLLTVKIIESIHKNPESIHHLIDSSPFLNRFNTTDIIESIQPS